jgi:hypothetical protein
MYNNYLECNAASDFSQQPLQGFNGLVGEYNTFGDLIYNNYLKCNAASGFSQQSLQGFDGIFRLGT